MRSRFDQSGLHFTHRHERGSNVIKLDAIVDEQLAHGVSLPLAKALGL
jgi:hypothetical protein